MNFIKFSYIKLKENLILTSIVFLICILLISLSISNIDFGENLCVNLLSSIITAVLTALIIGYRDEKQKYEREKLIKQNLKDETQRYISEIISIATSNLASPIGSRILETDFLKDFSIEDRLSTTKKVSKEINEKKEEIINFFSKETNKFVLHSLIERLSESLDKLNQFIIIYQKYISDNMFGKLLEVRNALNSLITIFQILENLYESNNLILSSLRDLYYESLKQLSDNCINLGNSIDI